MKRYTTKQRKLLLSFLEKHRDRPFSVEAMAEQLRETQDIGISSIYRNISHMVKEGSVQRISQEGSRKFLYQFVGEHICSEHLHLKCEKCGQLFHMNDPSMESILISAMQNNQFDLNRKKTILYGVCKSCH